MGARSWCERRNQPSPQHQQEQNSQEHNYQQEDLANNSHQDQTPAAAPSPGPPDYHKVQPLLPISTAILSSQTILEKQSKRRLQTISPPLPLESSVMYTDSTVKERQRLEMGLLRDRQVRLQSVQTDILLNLPPAIALPDGEEHHTHTCKLRDAHGAGYGSVQLIHLRDTEQESEIYREYIRPPPNRTVLERGLRENVLYPHHPPLYGSGGVCGSYNQHHTPPRFGFSLRTSSVDSDMVALLSGTESFSSLDCSKLHQQRESSQRYCKPPSYSPSEASSGGTKLKNNLTKEIGSSSDEVRTLSGNLEYKAPDDVPPGACLRVAAIPNESYEEYSDSPPPSYSDIVGSRELDNTALVSRQQSNGV